MASIEVQKPGITKKNVNWGTICILNHWEKWESRRHKQNIAITWQKYKSNVIKVVNKTHF